MWVCSWVSLFLTGNRNVQETSTTANNKSHFHWKKHTNFNSMYNKLVYSVNDMSGKLYILKEWRSHEWKNIKIKTMTCHHHSDTKFKQIFHHDIKNNTNGLKTVKTDTEMRMPTEYIALSARIVSWPSMTFSVIFISATFSNELYTKLQHMVAKNMCMGSQFNCHDWNEGLLNVTGISLVAVTYVKWVMIC